MATLWADGFEDATMANLSPAYTVVSTQSSVAGRRAGTLAISTVSASNIARTVPAAATMFASLALYPTAYRTTTRSFITFREGPDVHISLSIDSAGAIAAYRGDMITLLGTSATALFPLNTWTWLQIKVVISDTVGSVEVRDAAGVVMLNLTGIDTRNGSTSGVINIVQIGGMGTGAMQSRFDDFHIWDSTGSVCNTFTDDTRIDTLYPSADGDVTQFTPSAGSNFQCVDETSFNTTDYVDSSTAGHQDLYATTNLPHTPVSIFGVVRTVVAQKDDAGARSLKVLTKSGATINAGSAQTLSAGSNLRLADVLETDPDTSAAWTKAGVDAMQIGFENV